MSYKGLGTRGPITGAADTTGNNPGNWTVAFTTDVLACNVPQYEIYKMVVQGAPGTTFTVFVENKLWSVSVYGEMNEWDPNEPLILNSGQSLYFYYSDPVSDNIPPVVTLWLRYDAGLWGNTYS